MDGDDAAARVQEVRHSRCCELVRHRSRCVVAAWLRAVALMPSQPPAQLQQRLERSEVARNKMRDAVRAGLVANEQLKIEVAVRAPSLGHSAWCHARGCVNPDVLALASVDAPGAALGAVRGRCCALLSAGRPCGARQARG
jgi:hypothetical protein